MFFSKKNRTMKTKKKNKGLLTTASMLVGLGITLFTLTGCGECLSCLCPMCDGNPEMPDETAAYIISEMEPINGIDLSCIGCYNMQYSTSSCSACLGFYDATFRGCFNCFEYSSSASDLSGAFDLYLDESDESIDYCHTVTIIPGRCYGMAITDGDSGDFLVWGCLTK